MFGENKISREPFGYSVTLDVCLFEEEGHFIAHCPALDLSSYGDTQDEARVMFEKALKVFMEEVEKKGTLEKVLLDLGWKLQRKPEINYEPPVIDLKQNSPFMHYCDKDNQHFQSELNLSVM